MKILTDRGIRALNPRPHKTKPGEYIPYRVSDYRTRGLNIQVSKTGRWNWTLFGLCTDNGLTTNSPPAYRFRPHPYSAICDKIYLI